MKKNEENALMMEEIAVKDLQEITGGGIMEISTIGSVVFKPITTLPESKPWILSGAIAFPNYNLMR